MLLQWAGQGHQMVQKAWRQGVFCVLYPVLTCRGVAYGNVPGVRGGRQGVGR